MVSLNKALLNPDFWGGGGTLGGGWLNSHATTGSSNSPGFNPACCPTHVGSKLSRAWLQASSASLSSQLQHGMMTWPHWRPNAGWFVVKGLNFFGLCLDCSCSHHIDRYSFRSIPASNNKTAPPIIICFSILNSLSGDTQGKLVFLRLSHVARSYEKNRKSCQSYPGLSRFKSIFKCGVFLCPDPLEKNNFSM